ncbi:acyl-CoA thioesterase [Salinibaculum rarum]|uniref:acyl-CoA thioesterase n=1 Tax=Salinibaculum rarum TaxID=3058903 RepID=UPI00265DA9FD|nr:thioesterase family protein [Salinibaculum sp. KK48]
MAEFNYENEIDVRFRDFDMMDHVNNAVYATYLEQTRVEYIEDVVQEPLMDTGAVVADLHLDFERPIDFGESVTVAVRAGELGTSSIPLEYEIRADGEVAATGETLMVTFDQEAGEPTPIPDAWRERIEAHEGR